MAIWKLRATLLLDVDATRKEFKSLLENGSMNDILDRTVDMSLSRKDVKTFVKCREIKEKVE